MADPLSSLLMKKKEVQQPAGGYTPASATAPNPLQGGSLFDLDVSLGRSPSATSPSNGAGTQSQDATVGEHIFRALAPASNVDFPTVTEICERVAQVPSEAAEATRLLVGAFSERKGPARRRLKALTIMHELTHDKRAVAELKQIHGVRDALWDLQGTSNTGLGSSADEQIRMFATEIEKSCFGSTGDPFADTFSAPVASPVADFDGGDPFAPIGYSPPAPLGPSVPAAAVAQPAARKKDNAAMDKLWQFGSAMKGNLAAAGLSAQANLLAGVNEAKSSFSQGGHNGGRAPVSESGLQVRVWAELDIKFDGMLAGERVHHAVKQAFLLSNYPFCETAGRLLVTNYRLKFQVPKGSLREELSYLQERQLLDVPLGVIEETKLERSVSDAGIPELRLKVFGKDLRTMTLLLSDAADGATVEEAVQAFGMPGNMAILFAFKHADELWSGAGNGASVTNEGWDIYDPVAEYSRMGVDTPKVPNASCPWSLVNINREYGLCDTYPAMLVQPQGFPDHELRAVAGFRKRERLPSMSWCGGASLDYASLWRSSQPTEGLLGKSCHEDEKLVNTIRLGSPAGHNRDLLVVDLRQRKAAYANKVGGGGFEGYAGCRLVFGGIDNVHGVREAWKGMGQAVANVGSGEEAGTWLKDVANSGWYDILGAVMHCVLIVVKELSVNRCSSLIHCSDGWDRTAQVSSLSMLCLDGAYRTVRGFCILIQKEFCSFGHRFRTRLAIGERPTSESSPIFLQWLDGVYQLLAQFPNEFEFSPALLLFIGKEALTNRYGTFLGDNEKERAEKVAPYTISLWSVILGSNGAGTPSEFLNPQYVSTEGVLTPSPSQVNVKVWEDFWFRFTLCPSASIGRVSRQ